jgi:hypothetical protein
VKGGDFVGVGRPLKYKTAKEMQSKIDEYFEKSQGEFLKDDDGKYILNKYGEPVIINSKVPTVTGLALFLGFTSRQSLVDYQAKKEFLDTITRAKSRCEEYTESRLYDREGVRGAEFSLKYNFGWKIDTDSDVEQLKENIQTLAGIIRNPVLNRELPEDE